MADKAGRKKCTIDFGLTKELDYANFGVETETKTAEKERRCRYETRYICCFTYCGGCSGCHPATSKRK